jgi:hypothetical protein
MKKTKISRYILFIGIFSLITVFVFLIQQSYSRLMKPVNDLNTSSLLKPINPTLDMDIFSIIESKKTYQPTPSPMP